MTLKQAEAALFISDGACNPRAIARALVESLDEDTKEGGYDDPRIYSSATRLILDQLCWVAWRHQLYGQTIFAEYDWMEDRENCRKVVEVSSERGLNEVHQGRH